MSVATSGRQVRTVAGTPRSRPAARAKLRPAPRSDDWSRWNERVVLGQLLVCLVPSMAALLTARWVLAARWVFLGVFLFGLYNYMRGRPKDNLVLAVALLPALMILRNQFFYNAVSVVYAGVLAGTLLRDRKTFRSLHRSGIVWATYFATLFWLLSFMLTGLYYENLRILEMCLAGMVIVVLTSDPDRERYSTTLRALLLSLVIMGPVLLTFGDRLGMARLPNGAIMSNPMAFGVSSSLVFLLLVFERGKLLRLQDRPLVRSIATLSVGLLLLLSTSRGSWLVAIGGLGAIWIFNRTQRKAIIIGVVALVAASSLVTQTKYGSVLDNYYDKTFAAESELQDITTGRSDQWKLLPRIMKDAPLWGFGPGTGRRIYAEYSALYEDIGLHRGQALAWHSLFLQFLVETGAIGAFVLTVLFTGMLKHNLTVLKRTGDVTPLIGTTGFIVIGLSVSGMDAASGLYFGLGLSGSTGLHRSA